MHIKRDIKRELINTSKTGIHPNEIVNNAIAEIAQHETTSGSGTAPASASVPWLLKKQRELAEQGEDSNQNQDRDSSTKK